MTHKTKIIFLIALIFLAITLGAFTMIATQVNQAGLLLESRVSTISNQLALEKEYAKLNDLIEVTAAEREELSEYLLSESNTIDFLAEIEQIGSEQGVVLSTNSLDVDEGESHSVLSVSFAIGGPEPNVLRMIEILESLPYQSEIVSLQIKRGVETTANLSLALILI